jgi:hypothetical protein
MLRLNVSSSKNRKFYRIIDTVPKIGGGQKTVLIENLGPDLTLKDKFPYRDPPMLPKSVLQS